MCERETLFSDYSSKDGFHFLEKNLATKSSKLFVENFTTKNGTTILPGERSALAFILLHITKKKVKNIFDGFLERGKKKKTQKGFVLICVRRK